MSRSQEFLGYFNRIENYLQDMPKMRYGASFAQMIREGAKHDYVIRREQELLDDLRSLRNVLVHEAGNRIIAEPSAEAMIEIKRICNALEKPAKVYDIVEKDLIMVSKRNDLAQGLRLMKKHNYSQLPVYDGSGFAGMLTGNTVTRWMTDHMDDQDDLMQSLNDVSLEEVLKYSEQRDQVKFIPRHMMVKELLAMMVEEPSQSGLYIITQKGKSNEKPLALVTPEDYMELEQSI